MRPKPDTTQVVIVPTWRPVNARLGIQRHDVAASPKRQAGAAAFLKMPSTRLSSSVCVGEGLWSIHAAEFGALKRAQWASPRKLFIGLPRPSRRQAPTTAIVARFCACKQNGLKLSGDWQRRRRDHADCGIRLARGIHGKQEMSANLGELGVHPTKPVWPTKPLILNCWNGGHPKVIAGRNWLDYFYDHSPGTQKRIQSRWNWRARQNAHRHSCRPSDKHGERLGRLPGSES